MLKLRVDPDDDASAEAWALQTLAGQEVAPDLIASSTLARAQHLAASAPILRPLLRRLEPPRGTGGGVLLMAARAGRSLTSAELDDDDVVALAATIAHLHDVRVPARDAPRLECGSSVLGVAGVVEDTLGELVALGVPATSLAPWRRLLRVAGRFAETHHPGTRVRTICHGDLRLHNALWPDSLKGGPRCHLIDFEHAGVGDPAVDVALLSVRTPLSNDHELVLLDAYVTTSQRRDPGFLARYWALKPLLAIGAALGALLDQVRCRLGLRSSIAPLDMSRPIPELAEAVDVLRRVVPGASRAAPAEQMAEALWRSLPRSNAMLSTTRRRRSRSSGRRSIGHVGIDGTAASGKSVLAAALAGATGRRHLNSGALYRAAALIGLEHALRPGDDDEALLRILRRRRVTLDGQGGVEVDGQSLQSVLGVWAIEQVVSRWATRPAVRAWADARLADAMAEGPAVIEGRNITSDVVTAGSRFFVDADLDERVRRTVARLEGLVTASSVARVLRLRDHLDRTRALAPMRPTPGVVVVDTTRGSVETNLARVLRGLR